MDTLQNSYKSNPFLIWTSIGCTSNSCYSNKAHSQDKNGYIHCHVFQYPKPKYAIEPKVGLFGEPWLKTICAPDSIRTNRFDAGVCLCRWPIDPGTVSVLKDQHTKALLWGCGVLYTCAKYCRLCAFINFRAVWDIWKLVIVAYLVVEQAVGSQWYSRVYV